MASPFALPAGTDIGGFELVGLLGAGGFGITYEAISPTTRRRWAIKEFFPYGLASREDVTRVIYSENDTDTIQRALSQFERSTQKLCELDHPNILKVFHYVKANGTGYMVMDYVEGPTFEQWLRERGNAPSLAELQPVVEKVLDALDYAHSCNTVHRDIAPDNIIIRRNNNPVLIDFGALKVIDPDISARLSSLVVRKRHYSPPEQSEVGLEVRPAMDIYSLAAVLYRAITGAPPADAEDRKNAIAFRRQDPYQPLAQQLGDPAVSPAARRAIDRALAFHSEDRPQSVRAFRKDLNWGRPAVSAPEAITERIAPAVRPADRDTARSGGHRTRVAFVAIIVAVVALAGAAAFVLGSRGTNEVDARENALVRDAGYDAAKLQAYLASCTRCIARADVEARLALIKAEEGTYQAAKGSVERLEAYAAQCKACLHRDEAQRSANEMRQAELARVKTDDAAYQAARGSIERLENYARTCDLCRHRDAALKEANELRQAARVKADEDAYRAARGSIERLENYAKSCDLCRFRTAALEEAAKLRDQQKTPPVPPIADMQRPIDNLFAAWRKLDAKSYIAQWAPEGVSINLKTGKRSSISELAKDRTRLFASLASAETTYKATFRSFQNGIGEFDVSYSLTLRFRTGKGDKVFRESACESYKVRPLKEFALRLGGADWVIVENRDYKPC